MKPEIAEILLIGVILMGLTAPMTYSYEDIPMEFFVDPETGEPTIIIVVGSKAASEDVVSAARLAVKIGNMSSNNVIFVKPFTVVHSQIPGSAPTTLLALPDTETIGFPVVDVPDAERYAEWEQNSVPITYTGALWHFADVHEFWTNNDGSFEPWETHEEIQIRFDGSIDASEDSAYGPCLYGGSQDRDSWYEVPGLIYRIDNIFVPPSVLLSGYYPQSWEETWPSLSNVPEPWLVAHDMLPQFCLFSTLYTVVDGGVVLDQNLTTYEFGPLYGTPYMVTGDPHFKIVNLYKGESLELGSYTVTFVDMEGNPDKIRLKIQKNEELLEDFWMVIRPDDALPRYPHSSLGFSPNAEKESFPFDYYDTCNDVNGNGRLDPGEITSIFNVDSTFVQGLYYKDYYHRKWVLGYVERVWMDFEREYYVNDRGEYSTLAQVCNIAVDVARIFTDEKGSGSEIRAYWLENKRLWYNNSSVCDPWHSNFLYQVFLDAYESGWDICEGDTSKYQPPGTGLWPPLGLKKWMNQDCIFVGNGFLDCNDGHIGYEFKEGEGFPEQHDLDRDSDITNDCRDCQGSLKEACIDQCDIEDPVDWHGPGIIMVEMNVFKTHNECVSNYPYIISGPCGDSVYFLVTVTDRGGEEDSLHITYETTKESFTGELKTPYDIDETGLVVTDTDFDFAQWTTECSINIIFIGGPVVNTGVAQLVDEGISLVDWATSPGEWELITVYTCEILIVAGKDRQCTSAAVENLMNNLN